MKTLLIPLSLFVVFFIIGCSQGPEYVELNRDNLQKLDVNDVYEVDLVSISPMYDPDPKTWKGKHRNIFPIKDSKKIKCILQCIKEGEPVDYYTSRKLLFKTRKRIHHIGIGWDKKACYGDFWESAPLLKHLDSWGLKHPKGKKNLPKGQIFDGAPYDPNLINLNPNYIPFH